MSNAFEELRQRLDKKERELMANSDAFLDKNICEIDSYVRLISGRTTNLSQIVDEVKQ